MDHITEGEFAPVYALFAISSLKTCIDGKCTGDPDLLRINEAEIVCLKRASAGLITHDQHADAALDPINETVEGSAGGDICS